MQLELKIAETVLSVGMPKDDFNESWHWNWKVKTQKGVVILINKIHQMIGHLNQKTHQRRKKTRWTSRTLFPL